MLLLLTPAFPQTYSANYRPLGCVWPSLHGHFHLPVRALIHYWITLTCIRLFNTCLEYWKRFLTTSTCLCNIVTSSWGPNMTLEVATKVLKYLCNFLTISWRSNRALEHVTGFLLPSQFLKYSNHLLASQICPCTLLTTPDEPTKPLQHSNWLPMIQRAFGTINSVLQNYLCQWK